MSSMLKSKINSFWFEKISYLCKTTCAGGEMVDALVSGASGVKPV